MVEVEAEEEVEAEVLMSPAAEEIMIPTTEEIMIPAPTEEILISATEAEIDIDSKATVSRSLTNQTSSATGVVGMVTTVLNAALT